MGTREIDHKVRLIDGLAEKDFPKLPSKPHREIAKSAVLFVIGRTDEELEDDIRNFDDQCIDTPRGRFMLSQLNPLGFSLVDVISDIQAKTNDPRFPNGLKRQEYNKLRAELASRRTRLELAERFPITVRGLDNFLDHQKIQQAGEFADKAVFVLANTRRDNNK